MIDVRHHSDVNFTGLGIAVLLLLGIVMVLVHLGKKLPAVWRGDADAVPDLPSQMPFNVHPRSYVTFTMFAFAFFGGGAILIIRAPVLENIIPGASRLPGAVLLIAIVVPLVLHLIVNAFNRPKWLVPPPFRHQPGWVAARRDRRRRTEQGLPQTQHRVEIHHLIYDGIPNDWDLPTSLWWAKCAEPGCGWDTDNQTSEDAHDPEADLRRLAAAHSSQVVRVPDRRSHVA